MNSKYHIYMDENGDILHCTMGEERAADPAHIAEHLNHYRHVLLGVYPYRCEQLVIHNGCLCRLSDMEPIGTDESTAKIIAHQLK